MRHRQRRSFDPHFYAVHRESLVEPHAVLAHFARVRDCVHEHARSTGSTYLGQDARTIDFEKVECGSIYDAAEIAAVVRTDERAVDVMELAERLRGRVAAEPRIRFHPRTEIVGASRHNGAVSMRSLAHESRGRRFVRISPREVGARPALYANC